MADAAAVAAVLVNGLLGLIPFVLWKKKRFTRTYQDNVRELHDEMYAEACGEFSPILVEAFEEVVRQRGGLAALNNVTPDNLIQDFAAVMAANIDRRIATQSAIRMREAWRPLEFFNSVVKVFDHAVYLLVVALVATMLGVTSTIIGGGVLQVAAGVIVGTGGILFIVSVQLQFENWKSLKSLLQEYGY